MSTLDLIKEALENVSDDPYWGICNGICHNLQKQISKNNNSLTYEQLRIHHVNNKKFTMKTHKWNEEYFHHSSLIIEDKDNLYIIDPYSPDKIYTSMKDYFNSIKIRGETKSKVIDAPKPL